MAGGGDAPAGLALQVLSASTFSVIVVMAIVAATITPPLLTLAFRRTTLREEA